jgi:S1-C subfamily serine protease
MNAMGLVSDHIDGVVGYNLLSLFRIQLDLTQPKMLWTRTGEAPQAPESATAGGQAPKTPEFKRALKGVQQMTSMIQATSSLLAPAHVSTNVPRGFLGLTLEDSAAGPRIHNVLPAGPAAKAGLASGDLVLKVAVPDAEAVETRNVDAVLHAAAGLRGGEHLVFVVKRGTQRLKITVVAGKEGL